MPRAELTRPFGAVAVHRKGNLRSCRLLRGRCHFPQAHTCSYDLPPAARAETRRAGTTTSMPIPGIAMPPPAELW
jgi:hypothetical protein